MVPDASLSLMAKAIVNHTAPQNLVLRLYTNDYAPVAGSVAADFDEASGSGYAAKNLTGSSWSVSADDPAVAEYAAQSFTFTGDLGTVYGYFVTQSVSGLLVFAERFGVARVIVADDELVVTPRLRVGNA